MVVTEACYTRHPSPVYTVRLEYQGHLGLVVSAAAALADVASNVAAGEVAAVIAVAAAAAEF